MVGKSLPSCIIKSLQYKLFHLCGDEKSGQKERAAKWIHFAARPFLYST